MGEKTEHKVFTDVCPRCGSDDTGPDHLLGDDAETDFHCNACGLSYQAIHEDEQLAYLYWTDDEGEHFLYADNYLVRLAAPDLLAAAEGLLANARDNGECFIDQEDDRYDPAHPEQMYPDWARLDAAVRKAKGESREC